MSEVAAELAQLEARAEQLRGERDALIAASFTHGVLIKDIAEHAGVSATIVSRRLQALGLTTPGQSSQGR